MQTAINSTSNCIENFHGKKYVCFWMRRGKELAPRLVQSNWVNKYLAFRLRGIQSKMNCVFTSRPKDFSKIVLPSWASELSRDFNTRKIVYSTEKTDALEHSLRRNDDTVRKRDTFFQKAQQFFILLLLYCNLASSLFVVEWWLQKLGQQLASDWPLLQEINNTE